MDGLGRHPGGPLLPLRRDLLKRLVGGGIAGFQHGAGLASLGVSTTARHQDWVRFKIKSEGSKIPIHEKYLLVPPY